MVFLQFVPAVNAYPMNLMVYYSKGPHYFWWAISNQISIQVIQQYFKCSINSSSVGLSSIHTSDSESPSHWPSSVDSDSYLFQIRLLIFPLSVESSTPLAHLLRLVLWKALKSLSLLVQMAELVEFRDLCITIEYGLPSDLACPWLS